MLGNLNAHAVLPVSDLEQARKFYEKVVGLEETGRSDDEQAVMYRSGDTHVLVYQSAFAGTNQATAVTWETNDVAAAVESLKQKGVTFEHYEGLYPDMVLEGDVHRMGPMSVAWFKDPFGNILSIGNAL
jgi:catechol 2,3-dioxygenase-like lactoylglutathione lyase family enzyme